MRYSQSHDGEKALAVNVEFVRLREALGVLCLGEYSYYQTKWSKSIISGSVKVLL